MISKRSQYALKALLELSRRWGDGPVRIGEIAEVRRIPRKFLEVIMGDLRKGGFVAARRGSEGGYLLVRSPEQISIGSVIRYLEEEAYAVAASTARPKRGGRGEARADVFEPLWTRVRSEVSKILDGTTFRDLLEEEARAEREFIPSYAI